MGLFGNKHDKHDGHGDEEAARTEADRLTALPVPRLAAEILPAFGPGGPGEDGKETGTFQVAMYLMAKFPGGNQFVKELYGPIGEGIQALENAGLVERRVRNVGGSVVHVTRLGREALETGSADRHLAV